MKFPTVKKILGWSALTVLVLTLLSAAVVHLQINRAWGEYVAEVDTAPFERPQQALAIVNAQVLAVDGRSMRAGQTVLVDQDRIVAVGAGIDIPDNFQVIDGQGKFVIPGLTDSHVHLWQSPNDLLLYLANGVTHVRELNGSAEHLQWRADIDAGRPGPDLFVATRRHNSATWLPGLFQRWAAKVNPVTPGQDVSAAVRAIKTEGYDAIKLYTQLSPAHFAAFNAAAVEHDMPLLGHIPVQVSLEEIWASNMHELAHVEELVKALDREFGGYTRDTTDEFLAFVTERSAELMRRLSEQQIAVVSTLALMENLAPQKLDVAQALQSVPVAYVNPGIAEGLGAGVNIMGWHPEANIYRLPDNYPDDALDGNQRYWQTYARANQILLSAMASAEVRVLAGTDANVPVMVPGFSLHTELQALTRTGFSPAQALRSATAAPAEWMDRASGVIASGFQADLLLLNASPLDDIGNTQDIAAVISNGRHYDRATLDAMLAGVRAANSQ